MGAAIAQGEKFAVDVKDAYRATVDFDNFVCSNGYVADRGHNMFAHIADTFGIGEKCKNKTRSESFRE